MLSQVKIRYEGKSYEFSCSDKVTILDAAMDAGVDLPSSCHSGTCGACQARLISGKVTMEDQSFLNDEDIKSGLILACSAQCESEEVMVEFE